MTDFLAELAELGADERPAPGRPPDAQRERQGLFYGPGIIAGRLQFFSVSSLEKGDPDTVGGCPRRWLYEKVLGLKPEMGYSNVLGTQLHDENARYLTTGDRSSLGPLALAGLHMLPAPGPDLGVELEIARSDAALRTLKKVPELGWSGSAGLVSPLTCCGLPVVGKIDLRNPRGTNSGTTEILETTDPPGTVELHDHKTTSDLKWAKTAEQLPDTIQMAGYGVWEHRAHGTELVRLSHGYYVTKGRPRGEKRTVLVPVERVARRWDRAETTGRTLLDLVGETDASKAEYNLAACAFPRRRKVDIDAGIPDGCPHQAYCEGAKQHRITMLYGAQTGDGDMGLLDELLADNETPIGTELRGALGKIQDDGASRGWGFPTLGGEVAASWSGAPEASGKLGKLTISTKADAIKLAAELAASPSPKVPATAPAPAAPSPSAAAESSPAAAPGAGAAPADSRPPPDITTPGAVPGSSSPPAQPEKVKKTAKKIVSEITVPPGAIDPPVPIVAGTGLSRVLVDCRSSAPTRDLRPWVDAIATQLARAAKMIDIRSGADRDSPLAFGGWKGALHACVTAEAGKLDGQWHLDTTGDFAEIAVDALVGLAAAGKLEVVRGRR